MRQIITYNNKNWTLPEPVIPVYTGLKFTSTGASTLFISNVPDGRDLKYSLNNGLSWTQWDYSSISLNDGDVLCIKGNNSSGLSTSATQAKFIMTGILSASGNIMSLLDDSDGSSLNTIPSEYCFAYLFLGCTSLTSAPELPATTLTRFCYQAMFSGCSSLVSAPELNYNGVIPNYSYRYMFLNCSSLNYIKCMATGRTSGSTMTWVRGVAATGTFVKASTATFWGTGEGDIPSNWTVQDA